MSKTGLLILQPSKFELRRFYELVKVCAKQVENVLYVDFGFNPQTSPGVPSQKTFLRAEMYKVLEGIYKSRAKEINRLDIRVLLESESQNDAVERTFSNSLDVVFLDSSYKSESTIVERACLRYHFKNKEAMQFLDGFPEISEHLGQQVQEIKSYETVAVGGTFDRIHSGHRMLLSTSCLLTKSRIVVGVSDETLLVNKTLGELIEPLEVRMRNVAELIDDIKPGLIKDIVPLSDPAGPTKTDPNIECLVVSAETLNGGHAVNKIRKEAGLPEMELFSIKLVGHLEAKSSPEECKLSSTAGRHADLGMLLRPPKSNSNNSGIYVIGLTGGIASGKSSIAKRLKKLGAEIIDADLVGHSVYEPCTKAYNDIIASFGDKILDSNGSINRKRLGSIVFSDPEKLELLNSIVWPRIMERIKELVSELATKGAQICVVEAAVLLEAGWDEEVNEIWVSVIPEGEAIKRMKDRNGLSEEEAKKRLANQLKNKQRVSKANVVLSTLWEPEYTQKQVEKAWEGLQERIKT